MVGVVTAIMVICRQEIFYEFRWSFLTLARFCRSSIYYLFLAFICLWCLCILSYLGLVMVWWILGAVLNPDQFLPYATMAVTLITSRSEE